MTPKEKAEELVNKFTWPVNDDYFNDYNPFSKECALIAVNEILAIFYDDIQSMWVDDLNYWQEVKQQIEAL